MATKIPAQYAGKIALARARARLGGSKKKGGRKGGGRRRGGSSSSWFPSLGGGSLWELGSVAVLGGVTLGSFFRLPAWLSPIGAALWLYGMWRKNAMIRSFGMMLIALGFVDALGVPAAIAQKVQEAKAKGLVPMLGAGAAPVASDSGTIKRTGGSSLDSVVDNVVDIASAADRIGDALDNLA